MIPIQDKGELLRLLSDEELTARVGAYMKGKYLHDHLMKLGFKKWAPHLQKELCYKTGLVKIEGYAEPIQSSLKEGNELLPCPFCGKEPEWINLKHPSGIPALKCFECQFEMQQDRRDKTIFYWNRRASSLTPKSIRDSDGWISVETPPDAKCYVLLYGKGGRQFAALYDKQFFAYNPFNEELEECEEVTHWQPLPAPPNEKTKS